MITSLHGIIAEKEPTRLVLDVGGVGYEVFIPLSSYEKLPAIGESCRILVCENIREDAYQLFGFITEDERKMFLLLTNVSGIGPKTALGVLSALSISEIKNAVVNGDVERLHSVPGIGSKLAQRIIVELRDRISEGQAKGVPGRLTGIDETKIHDALLALSALGFKQNEARKMIQHVLSAPDAGSLCAEEIIRRALGGAVKR